MKLMMKMVQALVLVALVGLAPVVMAQGKDFSDGLTGLSSPHAPVVAPDKAADPAWQAQQKAAELAAEQALAKAPVETQAAADTSLGQLGPGDKVKLNVYGEEELSGEFEIDATGRLALPLIGDVKAQGLTPRELETSVAKILSNGYLVNPRVSVEVTNFRPFFILGEVNRPGSFPYTNDMTVINAVALAGGYTTRAKTGEVKLRRANDPSRTETWVTEDTKIYPGDVVRVDERFF
jgi:protein involved in polysaccharide export with SLBB domain